jgi:hypothetical protein
MTAAEIRESRFLFQTFCKAVFAAEIAVMGNMQTHGFDRCFSGVDRFNIRKITAAALTAHAILSNSCETPSDDNWKF